MGNLIRRTTSVREIGIIEPDSVITSAVSQFIQAADDRTKKIELNSGEFENNSLEQNSEFLRKNDNNPLVYGLKNLDRFAMIISGKSTAGSLMFVDSSKPMYSTANTFKHASLHDAVDIVLQNLHMNDAVKSGVAKKLRYAIEFNTICTAIAKDIQRGIGVFTSYTDSVYNTGYNALVEWSNNA
jgi:hypothetical protein